MNMADTAFIIICVALVMIMTPGVALFYGGMVSRKNVLSIFMQCLAVMALVSIQWVLFGYSLAFGSDFGGIIGGLNFVGFSNVGTEVHGTIPHQLFATFQLMFAIITVALITGAIAERTRFTAFVVFVLLWSTLVYDPLAHWVWGNGGWLLEMGALDFAGGTVVHISSGIAGLIASVVLGRRLGKEQEGIVPHNLPMTVIGAAILWFGWIGFNAGSALAVDGIAVNALLVTNICASVGALSWVLTEWFQHGKPTVLGVASGAVAGLVCITPAAGFVTPISAIIMGLVAGPVCYFAVSSIKNKFGYDDSLDVFGIHGVGGILGALLTGVFSTVAVNSNGTNGLLMGNPMLLWIQLEAVLITIIFVSIATFFILKLIQVFIPLRVSKEEEELGLDICLHGEEAYSYMVSTPQSLF